MHDYWYNRPDSDEKITFLLKQQCWKWQTCLSAGRQALASVVKLAYTYASEAYTERYVGSTPTTGTTYDLKGRFIEHNTSKVSSTKHKRPLKLKYYEAYLLKSDATRREKYLKTTEGERM